MPETRLHKLLEFLREQPDDLFLLYAVAMEYQGMHQPEEAENYFRQVMDRDQNYVPVYYQLGRLCEARGDEREAESLYRRGIEAAKLKRDDKAVRELQAALDELVL